MPYVFAFLVAANAIFMGYNLLQQEKRSGSLPDTLKQYDLSAGQPLDLVRPSQPLAPEDVPR